MKMANNLARLVLILSFISSSALAFDNYKVFHRDRVDLEVSTNYFSSEANYSSSGNESSLPSGSSYKLYDFTFEMRYMPRPGWSVMGAANLANADATNSIANRTNSSLTGVYAGFDFLAYSNTFEIVPEFVFLMPLEKIKTNEDSALNNEGVMEARARVTLQKDFGNILGLGYLGFTYRSDGRSMLMPWGLGGEFKLQKFRVGAEVFGYQSVIDDDDTGVKEASRVAYINTVNAGSMAFYSVNPSLVDSNFYAKWLINSNWTLKLGGGATLAGANMAAGYHMGAMIRYSWDLVAGYVDPNPKKFYEPTPVPTPAPAPVPKKSGNPYFYDEPVSSEKQVPYFKEDTEDGVDQKYFKPQKKKAPSVQDGEFDVELKPTKKKRP